MTKILDRMIRATRYLGPYSSSISLIAMTDPNRLSDPWTILHKLPRGSALIWRAYDEKPDYKIARKLADALRARGCLLIIAGRPDLGRRLGIAGIHLPERYLARHRCAAIQRDFPGSILTAACHSEKSIVAASRAGADAVLISPVLPTESHPGEGHLGVSKFARLVRRANGLGLSAYALGGISTLTEIARLRGTGAAGVAGIGFIIRNER